MPELPEVETVRCGLAAHLISCRVRSIELGRPDLRWPMPKAALDGLVGRTVRAIERRAKYLLLHFQGPDQPVVLAHLGMSGRLVLEASTREAPAWRTHEHWRMRVGRWWLRFDDPRRFGALDVVPGDQLAMHRLLRGLGPEPLGPAFDAAYLRAATRHRRVAVKTWLMNARQVVGVGNIYASEACYVAGIKPAKLVKRLTTAECQRLVVAVQHVLRAAIEAGGTTLRDYIGVDERAGRFQRELAVYGRAGEPCRACGSVIRHAVHTGRATYWCPGCQR